MSEIEFNPLSGRFDLVGSGGSSVNPIGDGSSSNPFKLLNVKKVPESVYWTIGENLESIVTRLQTVDGVLVVDGINTILDTTQVVDNTCCENSFLDAIIFG